VRSFAGIRSFFYRLLSVAAVLAVAGVAAAPVAAPARGDAPVRLAVYGFQNSAGATSATVNAMNASLYQAISTGGKFTAVGGGPLQAKADLAGGNFQPALDAAAKVGADQVVVGNVVQSDGGKIYYSLSIYRVVDVALVRSQIFSQGYPPPDARSMSAAFGSNIATLEAPRTAEGTIYDITNGELHADLGAAEGFRLGQRFNVLRAGQKVGEADIAKISDSFAVVTIANATAGYKPAIGDRLVGLEPQPAVMPPHEVTSGFSPLYAFIGLGAVLLAIGHHGQPADFVPQPNPSGSGGSFTLSGVTPTGSPLQPPVIFTIAFTQPFDSTLFDPANSTTLAYVTLTSQGGTQLRLSQLGTFAYTPSATAATTLTITGGQVMAAHDLATFTFLDGSTNGWVDTSGDTFVGATSQIQFSIGHKPLVSVHKPAPRPVTPGLPGRPVPGVPLPPKPIGPKPGVPPN
jgi:hypothetical protein